MGFSVLMFVTARSLSFSFNPVAIQRGPSASRAVNSKYLFRMRPVKYAGPRHYKSFSWGLRDQTSWYLRSMPLYSCTFGGSGVHCRFRDGPSKKKKGKKKDWSSLSLLYKSLCCIPLIDRTRAIVRWNLWARKFILQ